jgi:hypothetical protein
MAAVVLLFLKLEPVGAVYDRPFLAEATKYARS